MLRLPGATRGARRSAHPLFNAVRLVGADGLLLAHYRKTHLYGDYEKRWCTQGERPVVQAEVGGFTVGLLVCYDVEFPETVRAHALAGTDLLLVPTAVMHPCAFVAEALVPVRAFESQYVAYVNRAGGEGEFDFLGRSVLAGPDGAPVARAGATAELLCADVDHAAVAAAREANPDLRDRRPPLYSSLT